MKINEKLLKQKLFEKSILENEIMKAHKLSIINARKVQELLYDLMLVEDKIKEIQNS